MENLHILTSHHSKQWKWFETTCLRNWRTYTRCNNTWHFFILVSWIPAKIIKSVEQKASNCFLQLLKGKKKIRIEPLSFFCSCCLAWCFLSLHFEVSRMAKYKMVVKQMCVTDWSDRGTLTLLWLVLMCSTPIGQLEDEVTVWTCSWMVSKQGL